MFTQFADWAPMGTMLRSPARQKKVPTFALIAVTVFSLLMSLGGSTTLVALAKGGKPQYAVTIDEPPGIDGLTLNIFGTGEGNPFAGQFDQHNVRVEWGDSNANNTSTLNFTKSGDSFDGTWSNSHTYSAPGTYTVTAKLYHGKPPGAEASGDAPFSIQVTIPAQCSDGIDNDHDGLTDLVDPGCADADDNDEFNAPPPPITGFKWDDSKGDGVWDKDRNEKGKDDWNIALGQVGKQRGDGQIPIEIVAMDLTGNGGQFDVALPPDSLPGRYVLLEEQRDGWTTTSPHETQWAVDSFFDVEYRISIPVPEPQWNVDSFFDIEYRIDLQGQPQVHISTNGVLVPEPRFGNHFTPPVLGCTDSKALNFDPDATQNDESCVYPPQNPPETFTILGWKFENFERNWKSVLPGWMIELWDGNELLDSKPTDGNGFYFFTDVGEGDYQVCEQQQQGWLNLIPGLQEPCYDVSLPDDADEKGNVNLNFVNQLIPPKDVTPPVSAFDNGRDHEILRPIETELVALSLTGTSRDDLSGIDLAVQPSLKIYQVADDRVVTGENFADTFATNKGLNCNGLNQQVPVEIVALNLTSVNPLTATWEHNWTVPSSGLYCATVSGAADLAGNIEHTGVAGPFAVILPTLPPPPPPPPPPPSNNGGGGFGGNAVPPPVSPQVTLKVAKSVAETFTNPGGTLNYTIVVTNTGNATAINIVLTDALPAGFTYAAPLSGTTNTWNLGDMLAGTSQTVTYQAVVGAGVAAGTYVNTATVNASNFRTIQDDASIDVRAGAVLGFSELPKTGGPNIAAGVMVAVFATLVAFAALTLNSRRRRQALSRLGFRVERF